MLQVVLAPCSPFSVSERLMRESATLARKRGVRLHTHLCETMDEERYTLDRFGCRPIEYMQDLGWVDADVWYAHAVHVNDREIETLAVHGTGVCHCPTSNMRLGSGIAPVMRYLRAGVATGLGVDGSASNDGSNMLAETRQAMLLARLGPRAGDQHPARSGATARGLDVGATGTRTRNPRWCRGIGP